MKRLIQIVAVGVSPQAVPAASRRQDPDSRRMTPHGRFRGSLSKLCLLLFGSLLLDTHVQAQNSTDLPKNIRVIVEYIETSHELVTALMNREHADSGPKLHAHMRALVTTKKARILETSIFTARSGYRARVESVMEHIYPTEYEPPSLGARPPREERDTLARTKNPTAFDTRNVGLTLDIEPVIHTDQPVVDIRFTQNMTHLLRYNTCLEYHDRWGDASIRFPTYGSLESKGVLTVPDGAFGFVGLLTPHHSDGGRDTTRKILLFVRADIITPGS